MIPDFPEQKEKLMQFLTQYMDLKVQQLMGPFSMSTRYTHHEGDKWQLEREDGSGDFSKYQDFSVDFSISVNEVPNLTLEKLFIKIDGLAEEMANQASRYHYSKLFTAVDAVGNSINAHGQGITQDLFLEMLERIWVNFDEQGQEPIGLTFVVSPDQSRSLQENLENWKSDQTFNDRYDALIDKKRGEWRAREDLRKLVD